MNSAIQKIEGALKKNRSIHSALLGQRVFEKEEEGEKELLTLVYTDVRDPLVWGHVFKEEGQYISLLVGFETWFNAKDRHQVFKRFWHHLNYFGDWYPLDSLDGQGQEVYREHDLYDEAVEGLKEMIDAFDIDKVASEDSEIFQTDYRILGVYPFANRHANLPSYPK